MSDQFSISLTLDVDTVSLRMGSKDAATLSGGEFGVIRTHRTPKLLEGRSTLAALFVPGLTAST